LHRQLARQWIASRVLKHFEERTTMHSYQFFWRPIKFSLVQKISNLDTVSPLGLAPSFWCFSFQIVSSELDHKEQKEKKVATD
jgi:hypothetical protein